jgi:hypothetical protein
MDDNPFLVEGLTGRAEMTAALAHDNSMDGGAAAFAFFLFPPVDS